MSCSMWRLPMGSGARKIITIGTTTAVFKHLLPLLRDYHMLADGQVLLQRCLKNSQYTSYYVKFSRRMSVACILTRAIKINNGISSAESFPTHKSRHEQLEVC